MKHGSVLWRLWLSTLLLGLILGVAGLLAICIKVVLLAFAGLLFGIFLNTVCRWIFRYSPLSYRWAYAALVVLLLALLITVSWYLGGQIAAAASELWSELQTAAHRATEKIRSYEWGETLVPELEADRLLKNGDLATGVLTGLESLGWALTAFLVIGFIGLYSAFEPDLYTHGLTKLWPMDGRARAAEVLKQLHSALGYWMLGRVVSMVLVGVATAVFLSLLGVQLPIALGVIAALLTFIPNIGPVLAAVPQALLALELGTSTAAYVLLFNLILQVVESYVVTPLIQRRVATLPPASTIFVQLLLGVLFGTVGIFMAAPLTVAAMVIVQMLYIKDRLDDPHPGELAHDRS